MHHLRFVPAFFAIPAVLMMSSLAGAGALPATGCGAGPLCGQGFECAVVPTGCQNACDPQSMACSNICVGAYGYACVPAHCSADSECAPGMVCHAWPQACVVTNCACPPGETTCNCPPPACDVAAVSLCTPRYDLPCQTADDCGPGFLCEDSQTCDCAASGGSAAVPPPDFGGMAPIMGGSGGSGGSASLPAPIPGGAGGGGGADAMPTGCSCQPSGPKQCVLQQPLMCATAANCPAGWSCEVASAADPAAPACAPGEMCSSAPVPQPSGGWCRPPYYGATNSGDLQVPSTASSGIGTGTVGSSGTPNSSQTGSARNDSHEVASCSIGRAPASSGVLSLLTLASALLGLKRRRAGR